MPIFSSIQFQLLGVYSVSKTALLGLCKAAAENLSTYGIRVNCIAPGIIETKFSEPVCLYNFLILLSLLNRKKNKFYIFDIL